MVVVIAEEAAAGKVDSHLVPSSQVFGHNNSATVLLVICIFVCGPGNHPAVHLQTSAGCQLDTRSTGVTVD